MKKIKAEISARHVHLSQQDAEKLFGKNFKFKKIKDLSQPGEFAAQESVEIVNKDRRLNIRIVGPVRSATQVELAMTDCYFLRVFPEIRVSGDIANTPGITIKGPKGSIKIKQGVIVPQRHLHISEVDAKKWKIKNKQKLKVRIKGKRALTFDDVVARVSKNYSTAIHLDTDEANAAGLLKCGTVDLEI
ncbi:phosphate propanoyltransferase [Candidatus Parcubacteria bacterium]|nr:MAG: phosphate propanoyltransferase [Candidatus Parcubacteria bacterium]